VYSLTTQYFAAPGTVGTCSLSTAIVQTLAVIGPTPMFAPFYDAGPSLTLTLAGAASNPQATLALSGMSYTTPTTPPFLNAGAWTLSAPGGGDVRAFNANFTIPPIPQWTNSSLFDNQNVTRANGLTVTWTGGGPNDVMTISGNSSAAFLFGGIIQQFTCSAAASSGTFTVPASILTTFPVATGGSLSLSTTTTTKFTAPLTAGGNLDGGAIQWKYFNARTVNWQ
jgi:hypothetical protein